MCTPLGVPLDSALAKRMANWARMAFYLCETYAKTMRNVCENSLNCADLGLGGLLFGILWWVLYLIKQV